MMLKVHSIQNLIQTTDQIIVLGNITLQITLQCTITITMIVFKFDILPFQVQQGQRMESKLGKQW